MSNLMGKKVKKTVQAMTGGPQVEAIKPKPSINMIGQGMKRPLTKPSPSSSASSASPSQPVKKPRLDFSSTATVSKPPPSTSQSNANIRPPLDEQHKPFCEKTEVDYDNFETTLDEACRSEKFNKAARIICAALRDVERKKDSSGMVSFEENVMVVITKIIKEFGESLKHVNLSRSIFWLLCTTKGMQLDKQSLLVSWITHLNQAQSNADPVVITSYLHDALGERSWIDKPHSLELVTRILRYFGTRFPPRSMYNSCGGDVSTPEHIPDESLTSLYFGDDDDEERMRKSTLEYLQRSWEFHGDSPPRHVLRTINAFSAFPEVRLQAAKKIDGWLQNAKLQKAALEILLFLGCNIGDASTNEYDKETLSCLLKLRSYKSKMVTPVFAVMLKEFLSQNKENLRVVVQLLLMNEFGHPQHRFHLNMALFHALFSIDNKNTTKILGAEISSVMANREENYKPVRLFIRELVRSCLRTDFLFSNFAASFMERTVELGEKEGVNEVASHVARVTVDTCTWLPLVAITQQIKDAFANRRANGSAAPSAMETINKFQAEMREYHRVVIQSLHALHSIIDAPQMEMEYPKAFYRMLFLDSPDSYSILETGTADEIGQGIKVVLETPINEKLICLIAKCDSMNRDDRLNLLDALIRNAIHTRPASEIGTPLMNITTLNVFENLFKLAEFRDNGITLEPWFWKTWKVCLYLLCATPPPPIFTTAYDTYPMLRMLCKMILLGSFSFPIKLDGKSANVIKEEYEKQRQDDLQLGNLDPTAEEHLVRHYCMINPTSARPPPRQMAQELSQLAAAYQMSAELSQLRTPDLLSRLIEEEGTSAAMPAIEAVIRQKSDSHSFIPIVCITQFLLHHLAADPEKKTVDDSIILQMSSRLRDSVSLSISTGGGEGEDSLLLLLTRLGSGSRNEREAAVALVTYLFHPEIDFPHLPQSFSLERLAASPIFEKIRSSACSSISSAFRVESDPSRLDLYLRFITKHAKTDELHRLSTLLSFSSPRHDDSIRSSLVHFFARYVENASEGEEKTEWPMVYMDVKGKKISVVSSTLFFILELLSRFRGGGEGRDRLLSLILSPGGELPTVINEEGETVELLNDQLRGAMLSSTDESIVKVALATVDSTTAFNMICTFGLTTFSASNLLKNLDSLDESTLDEIPEVRRALPFVIAYRRRGAEGGDRFLSLLTPPVVDSTMKDEPMDECDELLLLPPPSIECSQSDLPMEMPHLTKIELSKKLKEMVSTASFSLTSLEFRSAAAFEASTDVCLECLELNLKFFLSHVGAFNDMVQLLCAASDKYPSVKAKLRTLCAKVLKSAAVPPAIEAQIRKLAEGPVPVPAPKTTLPTKKPLDLSCATAEDLLETLHKRKNMTNIERARLINRFVLLRPEIIDIRMTTTEVDRQIGRVFGVQSREGLDRLVAQLWLRASPETIECVLRRVLKQYNPSISSSAVMELLRHCASSPSYYRPLGKPELRVACAYMMELATDSFPSNPSFLLQLTSFLDDRLLPITGFSILEELAAHCLQVDRSIAARERRVAAAALLQELQKRFPRLHVSTSSTRVVIEGGHNGISGADKEMTMLVGHLLECKEDSIVASAIDSLTHTIHAHREIVLRQLPVLSRLIARITENPAAQIKEHRRFRWIINFLISSMIDLLDDLPAKNIEDLDRLIDGLLEFYQRHVSGTRDEVDLSRRVLDLILAYLKNQRTDAREFLQFVGGDRVTAMIEIVRDEAFEEIKRIIESA